MKKVWGKIIGTAFGFVVGHGLFGALIGFILGHAYDRNRAVFDTASSSNTRFRFATTPQMEAYIADIVVLGAKLAKADGQVTREEVDAFKRAFGFKNAHEKTIGRTFNEAKKTASGFEPHAFRLAQIFSTHPAMLDKILGDLFAIAMAEGPRINVAELRFLKQVAYIFNIMPDHFRGIAARAGAVLPDEDSGRDQTSRRASTSSDGPFDVLGLSNSATNDQIKSAYRDLIRKHHPDRLAATGASTESLAAATERMKDINAAYDTLCRLRGIK